MSPTSDNLRAAVNRAASGPGGEVATQQPSGSPTINQLIDAQRTAIARALPAHMNADRLARTVVTVIKSNPKLLECHPQSLLAALMLSAQLGLEPGPLGHCYFVPFRNNRARWVNERGATVTGARMEVQWILGYKGIIHLAMQSGMLASIEARPVFANDEFDFEYGLDERLRHIPADGDRGEIKRFYGIARFKDGGRYFTVMSKADVDKHRARSKTATDSGPWATDYEAMGCKTVIRTMQPYLPLSVEKVAAAMAADSRTQTISYDDTGVMDVTPDAEALPAGTGTPEPDAAPQPATITEDGSQVDTATGEALPLDEARPLDEPPADVEEPPEPEGWPETPAPGTKRGR